MDKLQNQFGVYAERLTQLSERIDEGEEPVSLEGYRDTFFDEQAQVNTFDLPHDTVGMVFSHDPDMEDTIPLPEHIINRVDTMTRTIGCAGLEQIVAYSLSGPSAIVVQEYGKYALNRVGGLELNSIPITDYEGLFNTFKTMERLRLTVFDDDYMASIDYAEPDIADLDALVPMTVFNYRDAGPEETSKHTLLHHVLGLGKEFAAYTLSTQEKEVPSFGIRYYVACERYLGSEISLQLVHMWLKRGFALPVVDYDPPY